MYSLHGGSRLARPFCTKATAKEARNKVGKAIVKEAAKDAKEKGATEAEIKDVIKATENIVNARRQTTVRFAHPDESESEVDSSDPESGSELDI